MRVKRDRDPSSGRMDIVVKTMADPDSSVAVERFRREAIILDLLAHPSIVRLRRYTDQAPRAMVLEYVPGAHLGKTVAESGPMEPSALCDIIEHIAAGLDVAHSHGVVHRDVCPEHIIMPKRGSTKLIDFGVASLAGEPQITLHGETLRDHAYISPEQLRGAAGVGPSADIYSISAVCFFALTGQPPGRGAVNVAMALHEKRPDLPTEVASVIARGMAAAPEDRYPSAGQMAADLRMAVEHDERNKPLGTASRNLWTATCFLIVALLLGAFVRSVSGFGNTPAHIATVHSFAKAFSHRTPAMPFPRADTMTQR